MMRLQVRWRLGSVCFVRVVGFAPVHLCICREDLAGKGGVGGVKLGLIIIYLGHTKKKTNAVQN